jgi:hypothetical protein
MSNGFATPGTSTGIKWADIDGALVVAIVHGLEDSINTSFGEKKDVPRIDLHVLDGDDAGEEFIDTLVFPTVLAQQLRRRVGEKVLGRIGQGVAKSGQSAPWMLHPATPEDQKVGAAWLEKRSALVSADDLI